MTDQRDQRKRLLMRAEQRLGEAAEALRELAESYPATGLSACHPKQGYSSTAGQIERLRKTLKRSRV